MPDDLDASGLIEIYQKSNNNIISVTQMYWRTATPGDGGVARPRGRHLSRSQAPSTPRSSTDQVCPRQTFDHTNDGVNEGWLGVGEGLGANGRF